MTPTACISLSILSQSKEKLVIGQSHGTPAQQLWPRGVYIVDLNSHHRRSRTIFHLAIERQPAECVHTVTHGNDHTDSNPSPADSPPRQQAAAHRTPGTATEEYRECSRQLLDGSSDGLDRPASGAV